MFTVSVNEEILAKLRSMLEDEDEGTCVRLREYTLGGGCRSRIVLGLAMEEMDEDEDESTVVEDVTFIADSDFLLRYGRKFALGFNEEKQVEVRALEEQN